MQEKIRALCVRGSARRKKQSEQAKKVLKTSTTVYVCERE